MMKIAFITDGGLERGMGHVQQSTTLARELSDRAEIYFLTKSDKTVVDQIKNAGFNTFKLNDDDEIANLLKERRPDRVIFDKLDVDEGLARKLKETLKAKLVIFTNLTSANKYADMAVTADIGSKFKNVKSLDEKTHKLIYYGPKYWILRREFYEFKKLGKKRPDKVAEILLIFGGSDFLNLTSAALDELLNLKSDFKIDVILGAHFEYFKEMNEVLAKHQDKKKKVNIYKNISNVAELMYKADLVIGSPGLSVFEALCVGTPVIVMPQNKLQKNTYQGFMRILDKDEAGKLGDIIANADFTYPDEEHIVKMEIGEGKTELIEEILK
jgi:UDP-2,4-diacetamido-2,4,6-trideoxy-beta-L-altropyranose hydrolase